MIHRVPGVYKRGRRWWVVYYLHGRQVRESIGFSYREAVKVRAQRITDIERGRLGVRPRRKTPTLVAFVETWRRDTVHLKPSTMEGYEKLLKNHILPAFGDCPLPAITREAVKRFIADKSRQQRQSRSPRNPNPNRPTLSQKTIRNAVALLAGLLESAASEYGLLDANPLQGILRRKNFPADAHRLTDDRVRVLEPDDFKAAVENLRRPVLDMVLVAALSGLRWGEQVALRGEDVNLRRNKLHIGRALYKRVPQMPKSQRSIRDVDLCPTVRRILQASRREGLVFSPDGERAIGDGSWIKRQWRKAQVSAGIKRALAWHDLRHEFVSLLIAAGKHPKYVAVQAGHSSAGFTMDRYGHLFDTLPIMPVEWWDDLLWPAGFRAERAQFMHKNEGHEPGTRVLIES